MPSIRNTLLLFLPAAALAGQHDCSQIVHDKQRWNLEPLAGPKSVHDVSFDSPSIENRTYSLDICAALVESSKLPKLYRFASGTYVGMKLYNYNLVEKKEVIDEVKNIAGQYHTTHGRALDPRYTRLKGSTDDEKLEGVRVELNGGMVEDRPQKAIIEFICDMGLTGLEGFKEETDDRMLFAQNNRTEIARRKEGNDDEDDDDDAEEPELPDLDKGKSLHFKSYGPSPNDDYDVLRLTWRSKYACEGQADSGDDGAGKKSSSWGFFTWFLIILFLLAATYIIFGSWLNYNRYGARGWDLIPHGDTIRDVPYIMKDWTHGAMDRLRGGPAGRGGYSAV